MRNRGDVEIAEVPCFPLPWNSVTQWLATKVVCCVGLEPVGNPVQPVLASAKPTLLWALQLSQLVSVFLANLYLLS